MLTLVASAVKHAVREHESICYSMMISATSMMISATSREVSVDSTEVSVDSTEYLLPAQRYLLNSRNHGKKYTQQVYLLQTLSLGRVY